MVKIRSYGQLTSETYVAIADKSILTLMGSHLDGIACEELSIDTGVLICVRGFRVLQNI